MSPLGLEHNGEGQLLHVHDLPQLYTKPRYSVLIATLDDLRKSSYSFDSDKGDDRKRTVVDEAGVPRYLTNIISSSLDWLNDEQQEVVLQLASQRLAERSGRNAAPSMTRPFRIREDLVIYLHEPSLTEDSLGLKTWTSSLLLARRLAEMEKYLPPTTSTVLELGAGTGLVGLAAAHIWTGRVSQVMLTDLPQIVPNVQRNIDAMTAGRVHSEHMSCQIESCVLDWSNNHEPDVLHDIIVAADPIYDSAHPRMLVDTVHRHIAKSAGARFMLELPIREGYAKERKDLRGRLEAFMTVVEEGQEVGYDDWEGYDGHPLEVVCWWSVWRLTQPDSVQQ